MSRKLIRPGMKLQRMTDIAHEGFQHSQQGPPPDLMTYSYDRRSSIDLLVMVADLGPGELGKRLDVVGHRPRMRR